MYCLMTINTLHTSFTYVADLTNLIDIKTYNNRTLPSLFNVFGNKTILDLRLKQKVSIIWVKNVVRDIPRFFISHSLSSVSVIIEFVFIKTYNIKYHIFMAVFRKGYQDLIYTRIVYNHSDSFSFNFITIIILTAKMESYNNDPSSVII